MKIVRLTVTLLLLVICINLSRAQQENIDTTAIHKIRDAEVKSSNIPVLAFHLTDAAGSRLTNSPGFYRAGNYIVAVMKSWGLSHVVYEPWGEYGRGWEPEVFSISMQVPYQASVIAYPEPWSANTNGAIRAPLYQLLYTDMVDPAYFEKHKKDFSGKIILLTNSNVQHDTDDFQPFARRLTDSELTHMQDYFYFSRKQLEDLHQQDVQVNEGKLRLKAAGALAVVIADGNNRDGTLVVEAPDGYEKDHSVLLPEAAISAEDGFKIKRLLASGQKVEFALNIQGKFYADDTKGYNLIAELPGTDPKLKDELVIIGAHLDSWNAATGATDNAAGCVVMMEAIRLLDSLHLAPKRTIRIILWSGEEEGMLGSYNYVKNHFGNAETGILKPEQTKISAYFNLDDGTGKIRGIFAQGNTAIQPIFKYWLAPFKDLGATTVTLSNSGSTDHESFDWVGIPAFQFIQDPLDYIIKTHHSNMDTYDYLRIEDLKQSAIIVASLIYQVGMRTELLPRKKMIKEKFHWEGM